MTPTQTSFRVSTVAALVALGFLGALFCTSLNTAAIWFGIIYGGIAVASLVAVIFWRVERRRDSRASALGLWIVIGVVILFLLLCIVLPSLG
jgi:hypothetical protein